MSRNLDLPKHWELKKLGEVCEIIMGQSPPSTTYNMEGKGLPFFQGKAEFTELYPVVEKWCDSPNKIAQPNDILLSVRAPVGTTNIANQKCCIGRGLAAIRYKNYKYVFYFLRSIEQQLDKKGTGTTFRAISGETIRTTDFPIPPLPEQAAIVAKIEELLSDLENGRQQLLTAQKQLKVYRQSLLKWAFEGKLTEEWRRSRVRVPSESPTTKVQVGSGFEPQIPKVGIETNGKNVPKVRFELGQLPEGWRWVKLSELTEVKDGTHDTPKYVEDGIPFITQKNIKETGLSFSDIKYITQEDHDKFFKRSDVTSNDILISMIGANRGMTCLVNDNRVFSIKNVGLIKSNPKVVNELYLLYFLKSTYSKNYIKSLSKGGAQEFVGLTELRKFPIMICPLEEQQTIVEELEAKLTVCDKIEETITTSLQQAETLRQSILKRAFEGKLV